VVIKGRRRNYTEEEWQHIVRQELHNVPIGRRAAVPARRFAPRGTMFGDMPGDFAYRGFMVGLVAGLLWHTITPAVDESIPLYSIGQYMNVQPTALPYSLEEQWFRVLFDVLARLWGHS
jgi:hypothetical protein